MQSMLFTKYQGRLRRQREKKTTHHPKIVGARPQLPLKRQRRYHSISKNLGPRNKLPPHPQKDADEISQTPGRKTSSPQLATSTVSAAVDSTAGDSSTDPSIDSSIDPSTDLSTGALTNEHWLPLANGRMRYLKAGRGPALILVHGLLGYSFSWRFTMPALAPSLGSWMTW